MTPYKHAQSSAAKYGGHADDYIELHEWFDETKQFTGDWTHRALRHHSAGVQWACDKFGHVIYPRSARCATQRQRGVPTKLLAEQHVMEDCGFIPTPKDWLLPLAQQPANWMLRVGTKSIIQPLVITNEHRTTTATAKVRRQSKQAAG